MEKSKVAILLCMRNAEPFLREQMDSFFSQTHDNWELWVSDDGSTDASRSIVREYADRGKSITVLDGPCRGATANFLSLARNADSDADFFAWADADDVWLPDKLARAARWLDTAGPGRPALYCGRTEVVDSRNRPMHLSPRFSRPPCFGNALCQNIGGGNTMAFNRDARELLRLGELPDVPYHDWWAYMLATGCGGKVHYDPEPCLRYRQHGGNLVGSNVSWRARVFRGRRLFAGAAMAWNRAHVEALRARSGSLTAESAAILDLFAKAVEAASRRRRFEYFLRSGVHRQSRLHSAALGVAALLGRYP